jgi:integrase
LRRELDRLSRHPNALMLPTLPANTAAQNELIPAKPALQVDKPKVSDSHVEAWEAESLAEFLQRCGHQRLGPLFELATYIGLRHGEICGLHWADVDFANRAIVVKRNRVSVDGRGAGDDHEDPFRAAPGAIVRRCCGCPADLGSRGSRKRLRTLRKLG